jgi:hypothetical protein
MRPASTQALPPWPEHLTWGPMVTGLEPGGRG